VSLSDFKRTGVAAYEDLQHWVTDWSAKITPEVVTIFGGEPLIHPKFWDICVLLRSAWPDSTIRLITNGYLLHKIPAAQWLTLNNFEIQVSIHRQDHEDFINQSIRAILETARGWKTQVLGGDQHPQISWTRPGLKIYKSIFKDFVVPYRQEAQVLKPWHSDPVQAHKICGAPDTPVLYKGRLYKCPPVANIPDLSPEYFPDQQGLNPEDDLTDFLLHIGKPESVCAQCPEQHQAVVIDHFDIKNVTVKQHF